jgi:hypothetical protein
MAVAAKKGSASDEIMSPGEMKPLLALSKREPVQAAIGLTSEGEGIILLDKKLKPKKVLATLKASAQKAKIQLQTATLRFGKAEVDTDYDPGMVRFFVNKEPPGNMRVKLLEVVKRIPYQKVELNVQPSLEEEPEDEVEGQTTTTTTATATAPTQPPPTAPSQPAAPQLDPKALASALGQLVQAIPKVANGDANVQKSLAALATAADAGLRANDLPAALQGINALRRALAEAMDAAKLRAQVGGGAVGPVVYAKSRLAWLAARKKMETDLETLRQRLIDHYKDAAIADDLDGRYAERVGPVLRNLDEELADTLDMAINETNPDKRKDLIEAARGVIKRYQDFVASEPIFGELDANPFVPLSVAKTMTATLTTLAAAVH